MSVVEHEKQTVCWGFYRTTMKRLNQPNSETIQWGWLVIQSILRTTALQGMPSKPQQTAQNVKQNTLRIIWSFCQSQALMWWIFDFEDALSLDKQRWVIEAQTTFRMLIPFQAYPVAPLARDARDASLALCIGRKTFMTSWSYLVRNNCSNHWSEMTLPLTQEHQGNLALPTITKIT